MRHENLRKILIDTNWTESIEKRRLEFQPTKKRIMNILAIIFIILATLLITYLFGYSRAEWPEQSEFEAWEQATALPEVDKFWKYEDGLVPHPRREPDQLRTVKISRYDPRLGGPNCATFVDGYCQSKLSNGEKWEDNFGISIAAPSGIPFGTIVEIGGRLWIVKDRGGKIVDTGSVVWVDQLSKSGIYPYGHELMASFWYPEVE
jgi:hypothetical protein